MVFAVAGMAAVGKLGVVQITPRRGQAQFAEYALGTAAGIVARKIGVIVQHGCKTRAADWVAVFFLFADTGGFQIGLPFQRRGNVQDLRGGIVFCLQAGHGGEIEPYACAGCGRTVLYFRRNSAFACFGSGFRRQYDTVGTQRFGAGIQHAVARHKGGGAVAYTAVDRYLRINGQPRLLVGNGRCLRQDVLCRRGQGVQTQHQCGSQPTEPYLGVKG